MYSTWYLIYSHPYPRGFRRSIQARLLQDIFSVQIIANTILFDTMSQTETGTAQEVAEFGTASEIPQMVGAWVTCFCVAWLAAILRIISRRMKRTDLGADDWLIITSLVCARLPFRYRTDG